MNEFTKYDSKDWGTAYGQGLEKALTFSESMKNEGYRPSVIVVGDLENEGAIEKQLNWKKLPNEEFDQDLLGEYTGAGVIFGVTGGVMEAAVRSANFLLTGEELEQTEFTPVRGLQGIKEASVTVAGITLNLAVASGMKNAKVLLDQIKSGESQYHFIEIMGCPSGCVNGGGQPFVKELFLPNEDDDIAQTYVQKRAQVLYDLDKGKAVRRSHLNKDVQRLYKGFLGKPGSHTSHHLLHTTYNVNREQYPTKK